jgi:valyl-tRNA synthetase
VTGTVEKLDAYRFNDAAQGLYQFTWNELCDWYVEAIKPVLYDEKDERKKLATKATLKYVLASTLKLLHPFLPFITEEIWSHLGAGGSRIIVAEYPKSQPGIPYEEDAAIFELIKERIEAIRNIRGEHNVKPGQKIAAISSESNPEPITVHKSYIENLARLETYEICTAGSEPPATQKAATSVVTGGTVYIPYSGLIDVKAEKERLTKEIDKVASNAKRIEGKLGNSKFTDKAPAAIVDKERGKLAEALETLTKLEEALSKLKDV